MPVSLALFLAQCLSAPQICILISLDAFPPNTCRPWISAVLAPCLAAEIDDDFKKELQYDDAFTHLANTAIAKKEVELLQKLEAIGEANAQRGESKQIERQLELLNPERYSKVTKLSHSMNGSGSSGGKITVSFEGDDKED